MLNEPGPHVLEHPPGAEPSHSQQPAHAGAGSGVALILVSGVTFGVMPVLARLAYAQGVNVKTLLALRFCLAAVGMWLIWSWLYRRGERPGIALRGLLPIVAMGAIGYVGQSFSYFTAASLIPASFTGLLLYTYPILVIALAWLFFKEPLTPHKLGALALGTAGTLLILGLVSKLSGGAGTALSGLNPEGVAWGLASAAIYSGYIIAGTRFTSHINPVFSSAVVITSAALVYLLWGGLGGELNTRFSPTGLLLAVLIAIICTVVAISAFLAGLRIAGPSRAAILSTAEPATTVLLSTLVLSETLQPEQLLGGALVLASVLLLQAGRR